MKIEREMFTGKPAQITLIAENDHDIRTIDHLMQKYEKSPGEEWTCGNCHNTFVPSGKEIATGRACCRHCGNYRGNCPSKEVN